MNLFMTFLHENATLLFVILLTELISEALHGPCSRRYTYYYVR